MGFLTTNFLENPMFTGFINMIMLNKKMKKNEENSTIINGLYHDTKFDKVADRFYN
jgi:uncharacterized protein YozE (UPF0346 family)